MLSSQPLPTGQIQLNTPLSFAAPSAAQAVQRRYGLGSIGDRQYTPRLTAANGRNFMSVIAVALGGPGVAIAPLLNSHAVMTQPLMTSFFSRTGIKIGKG